MRVRVRDWALVVLALSGCVGDIGDIDGPPGSGPTCTSDPIPGPSPIRRMTRFEYKNTIRDLLGDDVDPTGSFGAEEEGLGFNNNAASLITTQALAEQYMLAGEQISDRATTPLTKLLPCDPVALGDTCVAQFVDDFGARAFRRPLTAAEHTMFMAQYQAGTSIEDARLGVRMVIETALSSPAFLYRVEFGAAERAEGDAVPLTDWEMASRLSYFLWGTMPDETLFTAAEAGGLSTPEAVEAQARRMLDDPRARNLVVEFHKQWLDYSRVANITKDPSLFPDWSPAVGELMIEETSTFFEREVLDRDAALSTLLGAPRSYMNADLAAFYGVDGPQDASFSEVSLDPTQRAGFLTAGSLLVIQAHTNQTSPTLRGRFIREQLLCDPVDPPPPNVNAQAPTITPGSTGRDRFAQHTADPSCAGCHSMMDPIGFGFENYDAVARYRDSESGKPIDATGELVATDNDGPFDGVVALSQKLSTSRQVSDCYAKQWFRYGNGRGEVEEDTCTMEALADRFAEKGGNVKELLVALTQTDAFLYRPAGGAQ